MKQIFVILGSLLAATTALLFFAGQSVNRRQARKVSAAEAAEQLRTAWADAHTRA